MSLHAVIFDLFGTLVDDFIARTSPMNAELLAVLELPREIFAPHWRRTADMRTLGDFQTVEASIEHVLARIGVEISAERMARAVELRLNYIRQALQPRSEALPTIRRLKSTGYKIGLLSNCSIEIPLLWPETPFAGLFDAAVFSSRERMKKPQPEIYHLVCERLGVAPEECLYIADGENFELAAAARVGMRPVLLLNPHRDNNRELLREALEWQGSAISTLRETLTLVGAGKFQ